MMSDVVTESSSIRPGFVNFLPVKVLLKLMLCFSSQNCLFFRLALHYLLLVLNLKCYGVNFCVNRNIGNKRNTSHFAVFMNYQVLTRGKFVLETGIT